MGPRDQLLRRNTGNAHGLTIPCPALNGPTYALSLTQDYIMTVSPGAIWLITGCSSGFGRDLALAGLRHGYRVIATARKLAAIADLEAEGAAILQLDVTASPEALAAFAKEALQI